MEMYSAMLKYLVLFYLGLISARLSSAGLNILYKGTVTLRTSVPEFTGDVLVDGVQFFSYHPTFAIGKMESKSRKSMRQHVYGLQGDFTVIFSAVMKDLHHTEESVQWVFVCDEDDVNFTRAYMKISFKHSFIRFSLRNETWTPSNDLATAILQSLDTEYAAKGKSILKEECIYWEKQRKVGGSGGGSGGRSVGGQIGIAVSILICAGVAGIIFWKKKRILSESEVIPLEDVVPDPVKPSAEGPPMMSSMQGSPA